MQQFKKKLAIAALCSFTTIIPTTAIAIPISEAAREQYIVELKEGMELVTIDPAQALQHINFALKISPDSWEAWGQRALANERLGNYDRAIRDYTTALKLEPASLTFLRSMLLSRGRAYATIANHPKAIEDFNSVIATVITWDLVLDKDRTIITSAYLLRGQSYEAMNSYKAAMQDYNKVTELDSLNRLAYDLRSKLKEKLGDDNGALADRSKASGLTFQKVGNFEDKECFVRPLFSGIIICRKTPV